MNFNWIINEQARLERLEREHNMRVKKEARRTALLLSLERAIKDNDRDTALQLTYILEELQED